MIDILVFGVFIIVILASAWMVMSTMKRTQTVSFRRLYIQCVARLEVVAVLLNQMETLARHVDDKKSLDRYEEALRMMETLLTALQKVPLLPSGKELVSSLEPMVLKLENVTQESLDLFKKSLQKNNAFQKLWNSVEASKPPVKGCYFCSRPYSPKTFKRVQVKLGTGKLKVYGCAICRAALKSKGNVDVLYFNVGQKNVHWSENPAYDPRKDFWMIDKRQKNYQRPKLELISTHIDQD
ncbi:hypothetical protein [Pseudobacteriovorax antillogorgiicola]|uniref:Uncharacterized protein n=1 Tax=Pseudobacteriovorax antillogorgiicola TaxID=1513793 RepID=A0A1Y6B9G8_9BACT|nr:hypothetical protein [Pseudobacteriovorax antillogorgiicola]TCS59115.1 hypothetical protein EDD56_10118 [Pseudobacteriovorax antillogorgiicola]SME91656.1 hypothetical protein SAMN06296036_101468 [Pseudobacteriovorax antillogorgiicola]